MRACPAMATASSTRARIVHTSKTIWCAARSSVPILAAMPTVTVRLARSADVRISRSQPATARRRMTAGWGRRLTPWRATACLIHQTNMAAAAV